MHYHTIWHACAIAMLLQTIELKGESASFDQEGPIISTCQAATTDTLVMTVFVHGSIFVHLAIFNLLKVIKDKTENTLYRELIGYVREHPVLTHDQILGPLGGHLFEKSLVVPEVMQISQQGLSTHDQLQRMSPYAADFILPLYHQYNTKLYGDTVDYIYGSFGHLGLLSQKYRRQAAFEFYDWLVEVRNKYKPRYRTIIINLVGHSHGGNIVLNLYEAECARGEKLFINNACLWGLPVQRETAPYAYCQEFFGRVLNMYSVGDIIAPADIVSTDLHRSYCQFGHKKLLFPRPLYHQVFDIGVRVNNSKFRVDHANMFLLGRSRVAIKLLDPIPVAVLTPIIMEQLDVSCNVHPCSSDKLCQITEQGYELWVSVGNHQAKSSYIAPLYRSVNLANEALHAQKIVRQCWTPTHKGRSIFLHTPKDRAALGYAYKRYKERRKKQRLQIN